MDMSDSQWYPLNLCLGKNNCDIIVFLSKNVNVSFAIL